MKSPEQIIEEIKNNTGEVVQRKSTVGLMRAIINDAKEFFTNLFNYEKITNNKFDVEVKNPTKLPDVFKVDGSVSLKDTKALLIGLNEIVRGIEKSTKTYEQSSKGLEKNLKPEKVDFSKLEKSIDSIDIPKPLKEIFITNFPDYTKKLDELKKEISKLKLDPKIEVTPVVPKVSIDLEGVKNQLQVLIEAVSKPEEEPIGFSWTKNSEGNLSTLTEIYSNGKVISDGWDVGRVQINDKRSS